MSSKNTVLKDERAISMISADELKEQIEHRSKLRLVVRSLMGIVIMVYMALAYCLNYVAFFSPEYYISVITLVMNTCLFLAAIITNHVLTKKIEKTTELLKEGIQRDKADPWRL